MRKPTDEVKTNTKDLLNKGINLFTEIKPKKNIFKHQTSIFASVVKQLTSMSLAWVSFPTQKLSRVMDNLRY